jgi:hypothetical protein
LIEVIDANGMWDALKIKRLKANFEALTREASNLWPNIALNFFSWSH